LNTPHEAALAPVARLFLKPELNRPWSIQVRRTVDDLSFVLNLFAIVALNGLPLLAPGDNAGPQVREQSGDMIPVRDGLSVARTSSHPTLVITASQKGYVNEPLPLGIWLNDASGEETVTIGGLAEDTELSQGSSRGLAGWPLAARELDKTFVGPPKDFVGVMDATVKLSSAGGQLLESQVIRFEDGRRIAARARATRTSSSRSVTQCRADRKKPTTPHRVRKAWSNVIPRSSAAWALPASPDQGRRGFAAAR
jgi:hypothetical protein